MGRSALHIAGRILGVACLAAVLSGCADPVAPVGKLSDLDIPEPEASVGIADQSDGGGGFFARLGLSRPQPAEAGNSETAAAPRSGPDAQTVAVGTLLPFGEVARVCDLPAAQRGKEVARYPERGGRYRLYDSAPGQTAPHSFYLTGFPDGCARQFTAALAVFGRAGMHEQIRYVLPDAAQPYSDTDKAYEEVKSRICGVARQKPCGARLSHLERDTVFLSLYERFGSNARWSNLLLHGGQVLAQDIKSN